MKALLRTWPPYVAAAVLALLLSYVLKGSLGLMGMALGLVGTGFSVAALWAAIRLFAKAYEDVRTAKFATFLVVLAFFIKLPVFIGLGMLAQHLGEPAPTCFLLGLALVYSALVGWATAQN